ncbi:uncharacterized protein [Halyomorpha halys]|uniref:uncharacterized protein n=1 Tax=Halyomorpha halys TaxID=286706 RepID=UPI0034D1FBF0
MHRLCAFAVGEGATRSRALRRDRARFCLQKANWIHFRELLKDSKDSMTDFGVHDRRSVAVFARAVERWLLTCATQAIPHGYRRPKAVNWWTPELARLKQSVLCARRAYQREREAGRRFERRREWAGLKGQLFVSDSLDDNEYHETVRRDNDEFVPDLETRWLISMHDVREAVWSSRNGKAPGWDNISVEMLKAGWSEIGETLLRLFRLCVKYRVFPRRWKWGRIRARTEIRRQLTPTGLSVSYQYWEKSLKDLLWGRWTTSFKPVSTGDNTGSCEAGARRTPCWR